MCLQLYCVCFSSLFHFAHSFNMFHLIIFIFTDHQFKGIFRRLFSLYFFNSYLPHTYQSCVAKQMVDLSLSSHSFFFDIFIYVYFEYFFFSFFSFFCLVTIILIFVGVKKRIATSHFLIAVTYTVYGPCVWT